MVGFVDVEGQGDESDEYDALLVTPLLLLSKVIVFNWKGGVEKTSILKLLASLARAASKIDLGSDSDDGPIFGHLHIVFRRASTPFPRNLSAQVAIPRRHTGRHKQPCTH